MKLLSILSFIAVSTSCFAQVFSIDATSKTVAQGTDAVFTLTQTAAPSTVALYLPSADPCL